jgi:hypothetical protein
MTPVTTSASDSDAIHAAGDDTFRRTVEQMRQYFSLVDFLPVGVDGTAPLCGRRLSHVRGQHED